MEPQNLPPESAESQKQENRISRVIPYVGIMLLILLVVIFIIAQTGPQTGNIFGGGRNSDSLSGTYRMPNTLFRI